VLLPAALVLSNALNMVGIVVLPKLIEAEQFAIFSLSSSVGLFIVSVLFEWSRICTMRFSAAANPVEGAQRRATLHAANLWIACALLLLALVAQLWSTKYALIFGLASLFAVSQALFEARQASFRAEFRDKDYIRNILARSILGLLLLCGLAFCFQDASYTMWGWASSFAIVLVFSSNPFREPPVGKFNWQTLSFMMKFGMGVTVAAITTTALSPLVRLVATELIPLDEGGKMMLAMDISQKLVGVLGLSINLITLQATFRAKEFGDDKLASARITNQLSIVVAVIMPAVVGFLALAQPFSQIFVPQAYRDVFSMNITWCMVAAGLIGVRTFALDSVFLVAGRPYLSIVGPLVTVLATTLALVVIGSYAGFTSVVISQAVVVGAITGALGSAILSRLVFRFTISWGDLLKATAGCAGLYCAIALVPRLGEASLLVIATFVGSAVYCVVMIGSNALGLRSLFRRLPSNS